MSNTYNALTVTLAEDLREGEVEALSAAIRHLRGVLSVDPHVRDGLADHVAALRVRNELGQKLMGVLYPPKEARHG